VIGIKKNAMTGWGRAGYFVVWAVMLALAGAPSTRAYAQTSNLVSPDALGPGSAAPGKSSPGSGLTAPSPSAPFAQAVPMVPAGHVALALSARYGRDAPAIAGGLVWRIYAAKPDAGGIYRLVKEEKAAAATFVLPPGNYVVHASLGLASAAKAVQLRSETVREVFDIPAGGIRLEGRVGDARIPPGQISFEIFNGSQFDTTERRPIAQNVLTGDVVLLPQGTYYIVSNYGDGNSVVRSDVRVQAAKLTDVSVNHRAAVITLKLVNEPGSEALANTQWTVLTPGGDVIKESMGAFPRVVLAEGDYHVMARNAGKVFQRDFKVIAGVDGEVQVLAR
jgi:hypothetical protein